MNIQFEHVSVAFDKQIVLKDIKLEIKEGEFISLVGESGVGKTTFLRLLYFDLLPTDGTVRVGLFSSATIRKREIPQLRKMLGISFQDFKLLEDRNVHDNIAFVLEVVRQKKDFIKERIPEVLSLVGLEKKQHAMPHELSGGEQARVMLARAIANQPEILLADEPMGNLDLKTGMEILEVLKTINKNETTVIMASHNMEIVKKAGARVLQLKDGRLTDLNK
ncbi:MAG: ATP-binding cassette domain-containing protein [Ignavibacteriales bacterium]|nr:ATP-binding cassette domain-containing protein [Ignavibacteriales bacterium]